MATGLLIRALEQADFPALQELFRDLNPLDRPLALEGCGIDGACARYDVSITALQRERRP